MSYQVLARKWRPQSFRDMAGQTHVLQALVNALDHNRLHHAYLFTGTRGVGKTTIARILAKCLNCETGISSQPCGQCSACREITEGRFVDLIEIDAASRTKVEDTREILDNVQYLPARGRFKVYLIDEVHMLSTSSFNALLKTLEEPPAHVKFLLATTDPHKLPVTVLSRCLQFNLKNLAPEKIVEYLKEVLTREVIPFDNGALWLLARAADGSMRDALSLTDQAIAFGGESVAEAAVRDMLGTMDRRLIEPLLDALARHDVEAMLMAVAHLAEQNPDYSGALDELLSLLHRIAIVQAVPAVLEQTPDEREYLQDIASRMTAEDIQLYYQIGLNSQRDLSYAPDMRSGFEMALLRMLAFKPQGVINSDMEIAKKKTDLNPSSSITRPTAPINRTPSTTSPRAANILQAAASTKLDSSPADAATIDVKTASTPSSTPVKTPGTDSLTTENWPTLWQRLPLAGVIRNTAAHCCLERIENDNYFFTLDQEQAGLFDASHASRLGEALSAFLGKKHQVVIQTGMPTKATPQQVQQQKRAQLQHNAEESFRQDPNVQTLLQQFNGSIVADSITPFQKSTH
ncbi:MAG TPA: DNA polymerase III subunit gamma/tau [Pseudomonadales bacterium]|nr:DNA polymerase III subunit gamma/tau [Pseudomonadales bacterium]